MKNGTRVVKESRELIVGKVYLSCIEEDFNEAFTVEPCVGGISSGIQMKWRIRQVTNEGKEKVFVVMSGILFVVSNEYLFIEHNEVGVANRLEGYAIYSI